MTKPTKSMSSNSKDTSKSSPKIKLELDLTVVVLHAGHLCPLGLCPFVSIKNLENETNPFKW